MTCFEALQAAHMVDCPNLGLMFANIVHERDALI